MKTLPGAEFAQRFMRHVVPRRFVRVRPYGLLANGVKARRLTTVRSMLGTPVPPEPSEPQRECWPDVYRRLVGKDPLLCPARKLGRLSVVAELPRATSTIYRTVAARSP